jgi:MFS family permease
LSHPVLGTSSQSSRLKKGERVNGEKGRGKKGEKGKPRVDAANVDAAATNIDSPERANIDSPERVSIDSPESSASSSHFPSSHFSHASIPTASVAPLPPSPEKPSPMIGISRSAIVIGFVSLLSDISGEMIYPVLPIFITEVLHAPATVVGLIEGVAVGLSNVVSGVSGWLSDRMGRRKPIAFAGYALTALSRPVIAAAGAWPVVLAARFAERFGKGIRNAPRDALLAESTADEHRGRAFGFERAMDSAGAVLGPLIALVFVGWMGLAIRNIFLISAIPATLAALLLLTVREQPERIVVGARSLRLSLVGTTPEYRKLIFIIGVFGLANSANAFLILRAEQLGLSRGSTILAYTLYNAVAALASMPIGAVSDRMGRRNLLILGFLIYAVSYLGFAAASAAWLVWPLFLIYGLVPAFTEGVSKALVLDTSGSVGRATALGIYSAVTGLTQIVASYIGGLLWDKIDSRATFYFGAALALFSVVLLYLLLPSRARSVRS